jgi:3'-5' exoribonuclease
MIDQKELNRLNKGDPVDHYLIVRKSEIRLTKTNKEYLSLELGDKTLTLSANVWDNFENISSKINPGTVVKVKGSIDEFQGNPQIRISSIRAASEKDGISPADFLAHSKRDLNEMKSEFIDRMSRIGNNYLRELMQLIFSGERFEKYINVPAGKYWHHSYIHGLLEHTLEIIRICDLMCDIHPEVNRDILICGAMLHDFGKTEELSYEPVFEYTDKGKLLGHIVISAMLVNEETKKIKGFPEDLKDCLLHVILSHQGKLEFASPVVPKTLEAIALYQADELSAKVNAYKNAILHEQKSDSKWTKYISLVSTDLFNHGLSSESNEELNKSLFD